MNSRPAGVETMRLIELQAENVVASGAGTARDHGLTAKIASPQSTSSSPSNGDARHVHGSDRALLTALADLPTLLASAPHRLMFFAGTTAVVLSMSWWACVLAAGYFGHAFPAAPVPPGWAHAVFTQYGMLPFFIFGFLLTVFPRWVGQPALARRAYVPVFAGLFSGYLLVHLGLLGNRPLLVAGLCLMLVGWAFGLVALGRVLMLNCARDRHALSTFLALVFGAGGLACFAAFVLGAPAQFALIALKVGTFGLLLPVFFTVCHRMVPFFSASVVKSGYRTFKPAWSLPAAWGLIVAHLVLDLAHQQEWLWLTDAPLAALFLVHAIAWQPWKCMRPGLLAALHLAFAWLPIAFMLYTAQSGLTFFHHGLALGRAPIHALTIGFFGSMLVAMVTRVTQGHSGRALEMGAIPWITFALLQLVVVTRIYAEFSQDAPRWMLIAALGWLVAFVPWVVRSAWILTTPRTDGQPG